MDEIKIHHQSRGKVGSYFGVSRQVIIRLERALEEGKIIKTTRGRPGLISAKRGEEIKSIIANSNTNKTSPNKVELKDIFLTKIKESARDRGDSGLSVKSDISPNSVKSHDRSKKESQPRYSKFYLNGRHESGLWGWSLVALHGEHGRHSI